MAAETFAAARPEDQSFVLSAAIFGRSTTGRRTLLPFGNQVMQVRHDKESAAIVVSEIRIDIDSKVADLRL